MQKKCVKGKVHGIVQGVFFRKFVKQNADLLGVNGWVKNCADGTVEFFAQANEKELNEFLERLNEGPFGSRVDKVDFFGEKAQKLSGFSILYSQLLPV
jgi:acylphosphatase